MRKAHLMSAAVAAAALVLAGCGSSEADTSPSPSASAPMSVDAEADAAALESITWTDGEEGVPTLEFESPLSVTATTGRLVNDGDGEEIETGQLVSINYTVVSGTDQSPLYSTYELGTPEEIALTDGAIDPVLQDLLVGNHVGAQLLYGALDPATADESGAMETYVMAITVESVAEVLERAEGTTVEPAAGLPEVTLDDTGAPSVAIPEGDPSGEFEVQVLIEGDGPEVADSQSITAHYTGWLWDGEPFDSSWEAGAPRTFSLAPGSVITGWTEGLVGQKVGSQVLLVVPPDRGYGAEGNGPIPGDSTLVFVVDILAAS